MSGVPDYPEIVPKSANDARGIDFCGTDDNYYIIRSDLGVYMRCRNFNKGEDIKIFTLSQACQWGDHYLATSTHFYIIKGSNYRRVTNMNKDDNAVVYTLHPKCRGGSNYYSAFGNWYIVFANRGVYRRVKNMNTDEDAVEFRINKAFQDGLYFWGVTDYVYCLKQAGEWGVTYHRSTNMNKDEYPATFSVHKSVLNFVPGGVAQTNGRAFGYWDNIKSFTNETDVPVDWERTIKETVGFNRSKMSSIEHNWSIEAEVQKQSGLLSEAICKYQYSLKTQYGGKSVKTEQQDWNKITERSESIKLHIPPRSTMYVWQYQLGFGQEMNLFSPKLQITNNSKPPEEPSK